LRLLHIPAEAYRIRKQVAAKKLHGVVRYVSRTDKCRSRLLLEYFEENDTVNCGQCDVCRKRALHREEDRDFDRLVDFLRKWPAGSISLQELEQNIPAVTRHSHALLRWAAENGLISVSADKTVTLHREKLERI
jgi:ATP-dependent DNA helicase RecQ